MSKLDYFEHLSKDISNNQPKYLVIFLHGYGANGANLIELAYEYEKSMPQTRFIAPNAPQNWEGGFMDCYQWFSLASWGIDRDISKVSDNVKIAHKILSDFIDEELKKSNLTHDKLILVGFSQGAMMSCYYGLMSQHKIAGIISHSGKLILPEATNEKTQNKPEICFIHGRDDSVVGFENFIEAKELAKQNNIPFESYAFDNLDHAINIESLNAGIEFVKKIIK